MNFKYNYKSLFNSFVGKKNPRFHFLEFEFSFIESSQRNANNAIIIKLF